MAVHDLSWKRIVMKTAADPARRRRMDRLSVIFAIADDIEDLRIHAGTRNLGLVTISAVLSKPASLFRRDLLSTKSCLKFTLYRQDRAKSPLFNHR
jgi:hypothetical protein